MKLNKVLALALSGVMAVSMLAGCNKGGSTPDDGDQGTVTPAVGAAAAMNNVQDVIEFKDSEDLNARLTAAIAEAKYNDVKDASFTVSAPAKSGNIYTYLQKNLGSVYGFKNVISTFSPKKGESSSLTYLYVVESENISQETALNLVAVNLTANQATNYPSDAKVGNDWYAANYTGEVSVANVTKTEPEGTKTESAYVILVRVTQTVSNNKTTWDS